MATHGCSARAAGRLLGLTATVAIVLGACAPAPTTPATASTTASPALLKLRIATATTPPPALPNSVLWLAKTLGFYERAGLDVDLVEVQATPSVITALRTGAADVGDVNVEDVIKLTAARTLDLKAIHSSSGRNFFMIVARDNVGSVAELKGKPYAIARVGSQDHALSGQVLTALGVRPDDVSFVAIGAPNVRAQALVDGRVSATTMSIATWMAIRGQEHLKVLVNADDYFKAVPLINKVSAVTSTVLHDKPEQLRRFTAAIITTARHFAGNKAAWVDAMSALRPDLKRGDLEALWEQFRGAWAVNGQMNLDEYQKSADFLYATDDFQGVPRIPLQEWTDARFVDAVLDELGVDATADPPGRPIR